MACPAPRQKTSTMRPGHHAPITAGQRPAATSRGAGHPSPRSPADSGTHCVPGSKHAQRWPRVTALRAPQRGVGIGVIV